MVVTSQMAATAVVLIAIAISWTPRGIAMAASVEQRLEERMDIMEGNTEARLARLEVRIAQLVTSLRVDELIPKVDAVLMKLEENFHTTFDTLSSVLLAVEAASTTSSRVEMGLAKLEERSGKTEKKLDDIESGVGKGLGRLEESLARIEERSGKTEKKLDDIEIGVEKGLGWLEESLEKIEERLARMEERSGKTEEKMENIEKKIEEKLVRMEEKREEKLVRMEVKIEEGLERLEKQIAHLVTSLKEDELLPKVDAVLRRLKGSPSTISDPLPSALPSVAAVSTTSSTTQTSPPPMTPEEKKALGRALFEASKQGRARDVERLLQDGADVHYRREDWDNGTALHVAAMNGHVDAMTLLIAAGIDMNARDSTDWTPLHLSALLGQDAALQKLIDAGADVNSQSIYGDTPLHFASSSGRVAAAQALITAGAEVNKQDNLGETPLEEAASQGHKEMIKALIAVGARKDIRNSNGKTPYDVADPSVRDLLQP